MTVLASPMKRGGLLYPLPPSDGVSGAAGKIRDILQGALSELAASFAVRRSAEAVLIELQRLRSTASTPNWDGFGALPLDPRAVEQAKKFVQALPTTVPIPDVSVDPDGEVDLLWQVEPTRTISVSVGPNGKLTYAALIGSAETFGTEWIADEVPAPIMESLSRVLEVNR